MRSSMFSAQLTKLRYCSASWLASLNRNISVNTREYFRITAFLAIVYIGSLHFPIIYVRK
jgi:hypothetical protein